MSNYLAIATVTATLQRVLQAVIQQDIEGARATTLPPGGISTGAPEVGVNIFLYQVVSNHALANYDSTPNRTKANPLNRQVVVDLYYMMSCYGNDAELQPQRVLGSVVSTLADKRILTPELIRSTCNDATFPFLADSDLADQIQQINIVPVDISLEDLSKAWSVFYQVPYVLSIAYRACLVVVEGRENFQKALPIRDTSPAGITPFPATPHIEQVLPQGNRFEPIVLGTVVIIRGRNLQSQTVEIKIGELLFSPLSVQDREITFALAEVTAIRAGVQSIQVLHRLASTSPLMTNTVTSNVMAFVLCPTIINVTVSQLEAVEDNLRSALLTVQLDVTVQEKQKVSIALNEWTTDSPAIYMFDRPPLSESSNIIEIPINNVKVGEYLLRINIDGAESKLGIDDNPGSPTFNWYNSPKISLS
ncbi:DUF4255 domain-containing protein [Pseudanabaena mucicola]|uniref:DUF4255 domain-containing protein n=1 Tax=Pseudanabaena mucicola FACHB-723 TaxID=2692860 RepID=A0ABR7ZZJ3_9CYAN|nr:DUF4255 domain-containing protein [Pseudanabaena mucicola]MBD2189431.1 DUF4255 domain-containing protein [Pseudanabaena mucicola FACHB-723]